MTSFEKILIGITVTCSSALILLNVYDVLREPAVETIIDTNNKAVVTTKVTAKINTKVNINTATKTQLMELDGIGEAYANRIIDYRNNKKFKNITQLLNIKGIGPATFAKLKDKITV